MTRVKLITKNGYDFYNVASALQKSIRRNQPHIAGYCALELFHSNYKEYVWKRLLTISAEDCYSSTITTEVFNLFQSFRLMNKTDKDISKGRIFISKAVLILCRELKSRDADHLQNLVYDKKEIDEGELNTFITMVELEENIELPEYTYDCHTYEGKMRGKTKKDFLKDEFFYLNPLQKGLFDNLITR